MTDGTRDWQPDAEAEKVTANLKGDAVQIAAYLIQRCGDFIYDRERATLIAAFLRATGPGAAPRPDDVRAIVNDRQPDEPPRSETEPPIDWSTMHPAIRYVEVGWWAADGARSKLVHRPAGPGAAPRPDEAVLLRQIDELRQERAAIKAALGLAGGGVGLSLVEEIKLLKRAAPVEAPQPCHSGFQFDKDHECP